MCRDYPWRRSIDRSVERERNVVAQGRRIEAGDEGAHDPGPLENPAGGRHQVQVYMGARQQPRPRLDQSTVVRDIDDGELRSRAQPSP
jgi:hypothetical protein